MIDLELIHFMWLLVELNAMLLHLSAYYIYNIKLLLNYHSEQEGHLRDVILMLFKQQCLIVYL